MLLLDEGAELIGVSGSDVGEGVGRELLAVIVADITAVLLSSA